MWSFLFLLEDKQPFLGTRVQPTSIFAFVCRRTTRGGGEGVHSLSSDKERTKKTD